MLGTRFRAQGRDPRRGLDCAGLVALAFRLDRSAIPDDYRLSSPRRYEEWIERIERRFRRVTTGKPGNLVALDVGSRRLHLGVLSERGMVHADLKRGAVIEGPLPEGAKVIGAYRLRRRPVGGGR